MTTIMRVTTIAVLTLGLGLPTGARAVASGEAAPDFTLTDTSGKEHSLSAYRGKHVILEWINHGCPYVKKHYSSDNMQALQREMAGRDVIWLTICSSAPGKQGYYSSAEWSEQVIAHKMASAAVLIDEDGKVGMLYGAKTTPHMYVIDPEGALIYQGAIDDKPTTDVADVPGAVNFVKAAIAASEAGQPVEPNTTKPYGCGVKY